MSGKLSRWLDGAVSLLQNGKWRQFHSFLSFLLILALALLATQVRSLTPLGTWWQLMAIIALAILVIGHGITGVWRGAFIDERNVISLSRFQMLAWTVLILSAFMTAAFWNVGLGLPQPLNLIKLDPTLWLLMGISTASVVASPFLLSGKKGQTPDSGEMQRTFELLSRQGDTGITNLGTVVANRDMSQARWTDMFTGEETGNAAHMDLSRVQMFIFTLISLLIYGVALGGMFRNEIFACRGFADFPQMTEGLLWLIGISHAGYLAMKAMPQSQTGASNAAPASAGGNNVPTAG